MNLHAMLLEREAAGRPVTVGLIGAGKFGTMFLAQAADDPRTARRRRRRSRRCARAAPACAPPAGTSRRFRRQSLGDAFKTGRTHVTPDAEAADRLSRDRSDRRGDRRSGSRHPPCLGRDRPRQAYRHGQCRGRRARGPFARAQGEKRGRGLQPGLGRPARAHLRARRLGARLRLHGDRRRQGHALRAALSSLHARHRVGHSRQIPVDRGPQFDQSENVQQLRRRHQIRHRDDRGLQRDRPACRRATAWAFRRRRVSSSPRCASRKRPAARSRRRASPK